MYLRLFLPAALCLAMLSTAQSQETANPTPAQAAPEADQPHRLPGIKNLPTRPDPYPEQGKRRHLEGRVLLEFRLDPSGKPVSISIVQAEADPVLQAGALKLVQNIRYNMAMPGFDATDPRPFLLTVKFGLPNSPRFATYPGSTELTISGSPLPPGFR